ncbi:hypothetical protein AX769_16545 [Frondihabitans sp. PAMC 28766]|uniref:RNA polymerase sigma factor n=1 Tax=Frondihabitans sp. PAMC 28766 TaxID=1795630 RepID=UPI00078EE533|nr:RNA polymerase sigma factor [Frondihabitans sp. PAMC 28766]AMM21447.1 hypothetical protein AX769_16545 [Frondihabitans sp. PAMC 28766]
MDTITGDQREWALAVAGDGRAFGRIFDRHAPRLRRHVSALVPTAADADDVVAITFATAWEKRAGVRFVDASILPWLLVTATNTAHNLTRAQRRYRAFLARFPVDSPVPDTADTVADDALSTSLARLSLRDQEVLVLCVVEGLSEREAAATLGVPPGTVKSRLSRAKSRLKQQYTASTSPIGASS